jgi:hypothetical protein
MRQFRSFLWTCRLSKDSKILRRLRFAPKVLHAETSEFWRVSPTLDSVPANQLAQVSGVTINLRRGHGRRERRRQPEIQERIRVKGA